MPPRVFIIIRIIHYLISTIIRTSFFSDLSYPEFKHYGIWSLRVRGEYCWRYFPHPVSMTRAARRIHEALNQSWCSLHDLEKESPLCRRRIISLINRVHTDRNRIFHSLTPFHSLSYHFINGDWKHYWEHYVRFSDSQWGSIGCSDGRSLNIKVSDLFSKDECYLNNDDNYVKYVRGESQQGTHTSSFVN